MKRQLLTKMLLMAATLFMGTSAWAQTTAFSQDFTDLGSTDPADYGFTVTYGAGSSAELVNFTVTGGVLQCAAGPYASAGAGARTGTATATFSSISAGNEVTVSYVWALGAATGNTSGSYTKTRIGNSSGNALELSFFGSESNGSLKVNGTTVKSGNTAIRNTTYTVNATLNMNTQKITSLILTCSNASFSYTAPDVIDFASDITSVDRFAFENSERQNWTNTSSIDDLSITYAEAKESVESFVVNYKYNGEVIVSENMGTAGLYAGDSYTVPFRMYVSKDGALYKTTANGSNPYYGDAITLTKNTVVNKTLSTVDLNGGTLVLLEDLDDTDGENAGIRASFQSAYNNKAYTSSVTLPSGIYTFIVRAMNKGRGSSIAVGGTTVAEIADIVGKNTWGDKTFTDVVIPDAGNVTLVKGGSNTIDCYDIIIAIRTGDLTVPATITAAGWATLYTPYALDFSTLSAEVEAYTATLSGTTVTLNPVTTVPANTGVVLKKIGGTGSYDIPVIASSATAQGDLQGNASAATAFDAFGGYDLYMLAQSGGDVQFKKVASGSIAAGKAFLKVAQSSAPALDVVINGFTGIDATLMNNERVSGEIYNFQGQRVAQPTKGLYIVNGKKVVIK